MFRVYLTTLLCLALLFSVGRSTEGATTIPNDIKSVVTFIFAPNEKDVLFPIGTGFFVSVVSERDPNTNYGYLVTAKHVIRNDKGGYQPRIAVRLNKRSGEAEFIGISLEGKDAFPVHTHSDPDVDLAVIPLLPSPEIYDFKVLPESMLASRERFKEANIRDGDEVFFTGLFGPFFGAKRNYPIARFGRVALLANEKIPWKEKGEIKLLDLYLIEIQSFGGNSGSPVFFSLGAARESGSIVVGGDKILLAGVMRGTFLDAKEIKEIETRTIPFSFENTGIAAVTPAYKLHEVLFSSELKKIRTSSKGAK